MALPILLRELNEGDFFECQGFLYRLIQRGWDGCLCETNLGELIILSRYEVVELSELPF